MISKMYKEATSDYNLIFSNCGEAVHAALEIDGLRGGNYISPNSEFDYIRDNTNNTYYER